MPLPPSVEREELHHRSISMKVYRRKDGLYDVGGASRRYQAFFLSAAGPACVLRPRARPCTTSGCGWFWMINTPSMRSKWRLTPQLSPTAPGRPRSCRRSSARASARDGPRCFAKALPAPTTARIWSNSCSHWRRPRCSASAARGRYPTVSRRVESRHRSIAATPGRPSAS